MARDENPVILLTGSQRHLWNEFDGIFPTERELAAAAIALGAERIQPLSNQETDLVRRLRTHPPSFSKAILSRLREMILAGLDPLGEAFCVLRPPEQRRADGATYTPTAIVNAMVGWAATQRVPGRIVDPGVGSGRFLESTRQEAEANKRQQELTSKLANAESRENAANASIEKLREIDSMNREQLDETKSTLNDVRSTLASTRNDLDEQSAANVITSLATSDEYVRDIFVYVPFTSHARRETTFRDALLPSFHEGRCKDIVVVTFRLQTGDHYETMKYGPGDREQSQKTYGSTTNLFSTIIPSSWLSHTPMLSIILKTAEQTSSNEEIFSAAVRPLNHSLPAAQMYAAAVNAAAETVMFEATAAHMPQSCVDEIDDYYRVALDRAVMMVALVQKQNEVMVFKLRKIAQRRRQGAAGATFVFASGPIVIPTDMLARSARLLWGDSPSGQSK